jgi:deuterolysin
MGVLNGGRFAEYFGTTDPSVRRTVAQRFNAVAAECRASPGGGATTTHCTDRNNVNLPTEYLFFAA